MSTREHWDTIYEARGPAELSWYQPVPVMSLRMIEEAGLPSDARILDVGGGTSNLVDELLKRGYSRLSVLDLSPRAIGLAQARLGPGAASVTWLEGDVRRVELPPHGYDLWHDRALFHFLADAGDRAAYVAKVLGAIRSGGYVVMATFAADGPRSCSGLPVVRYTPAGLAAELGEPFRLVEHEHVEHRTPGDSVQRFVFCRFRRV